MRDRGLMRDIIVMNDSVYTYADPASCLQSVPSPGTCCLSYLSLGPASRWRTDSGPASTLPSTSTSSTPGTAAPPPTPAAQVPRHLHCVQSDA